MDSGALICLIICIVMSLIVLLLLLSMDSLEPLEYGITYNKITKTIGTEIFESGRYFIGPFKSFIVYPANLNTVEFSDSRRASVRKLKIKIIIDSLNSQMLYKLEPQKGSLWDCTYHSSTKSIKMTFQNCTT